VVAVAMKQIKPYHCTTPLLPTGWLKTRTQIFATPIFIPDCTILDCQGQTMNTYGWPTPVLEQSAWHLEGWPSTAWHWILQVVFTHLLSKVWFRHCYRTLCWGPFWFAAFLTAFLISWFSWSVTADFLWMFSMDLLPFIRAGDYQLPVLR